MTNETEKKAKQLDTPTKALSFVDKDYFPNIYVILAISVTSCECETSVSVLKFTTTKKGANHIMISQVICFFISVIKTVIILVQI